MGLFWLLFSARLSTQRKPARRFIDTLQWIPSQMSLETQRGGGARWQSSDIKVFQWWRRQIREEAREGFNPQNDSHEFTVTLIFFFCASNRRQAAFRAFRVQPWKGHSKEAGAITVISRYRKWQTLPQRWDKADERVKYDWLQHRWNQELPHYGADC